MADKLVKVIKLNLNDIPDRSVGKAKQEVGDFVINEVIRHLEQGKSPVQGESFDKLTKEYADNQKQGNRIANLNLEGDLREAINFRWRGIDSAIEYGVYGKEVDKADGHNQLTSEAKSWASQTGFPKRRFIPDGRQKFNNSINNGIAKILDGFRVDEKIEEEIELEIEEALEGPEEIELEIEEALEGPEGIEITVDAILGGGVLDDLFEGS